jgi:hypothetical protein
MSGDLSFLHPAQDPSEECTARARTRVERTVRRRRTRRRALVSAPIAGGVAAVAISATGPWRGDRSPEVVAGGPDVDAESGLDVDPDTAWEDATLSEDGHTLTILVGVRPEGTGPCEQTFHYDLVETAESVTIGFGEEAAVPLPDGGGCEEMLAPQRFDVELTAPLGEREVYDGVESEPRVVHHLAELVEVTQLPDGWVAQEPAPGVGHSGEGWQQMFLRDGADWYFSVMQEPTSGAVPPEGTAEPVTVNGIEGQRYSGQMNNTMETIRWVDGDLTLSVWGEMQGPPTFTHHDELLQIAEGVRLPATSG